MSYDIFFVRRDPGQSFEDALGELEDSMDEGDLGELTDDDLARWAALVPEARAVLGEVDVEDDDNRRALIARATGIELTLVGGEIEVHVPSSSGIDSLALMETVHELARVVEDVTGLEGYDPQAGMPISGEEGDLPSRRDLSIDPDDDDDDDDFGTAPLRRVEPPVGDPRPDLAPEAVGRPRRWWEFWRA